MPSRNAILIFLKHPEPGKVKTRLAATVGAERAAAIYRLLAREVFQRLPQDAEIIVMFDPPEREAEIRAWIHSIQPSHATQFVAQRGPGLGERLNHAFAQALAQGFQKVAAIGTDCIDLTPSLFAETWQALDQHDCVLGPAEDGGYYLIAMKALQVPVFEDIAWSTPSVYAQTLARLHEANLSFVSLPMLPDVDNESDWLAVSGRF